MTIELTQKYELVTPGCGCEAFAMAASTVRRWRRGHIGWHCPTCGQGRIFKGETREQRELREAQQELAQQRAAARTAEQKAKQSARRYKRIRTRVQNGVCPCCNRTFTNLARHMATKHPEQESNERLRHLRTQYGLTQSDLAREVGVLPAYVSNYERRKYVPEYAATAIGGWLESQEEA